MTVVADANLALKWVVPEVNSDVAQAVRFRWQSSGESPVAPPIFRSEVTNALYQIVRRGRLLIEDAAAALDAVMPAVAIVEPAGLYEGALTIADELGIGATYDALYVALAELESCELWTADQRLVRAAQTRFPRVRWIGEAY